MTAIDQMDEEYLPVTAEQAWLSMKVLEAQFTEADWSRQSTAEAFWAEHPDSLRLAANWCTPWDGAFNLWFHARKIWQHYVETKRPLLVGAELVRAIEARNGGEYGLVSANQLRVFESVLEECASDTADIDERIRIFGLLEDLHDAVEIVPGVESAAVGPLMLIEEVKYQACICRTREDDDWPGQGWLLDLLDRHYFNPESLLAFTREIIRLVPAEDRSNAIRIANSGLATVGLDHLDPASV